MQIFITKFKEIIGYKVLILFYNVSEKNIEVLNIYLVNSRDCNVIVMNFQKVSNLLI